MELEFWQIFEKILKHTTSSKSVQWEPSCSVRANIRKDRWTDITKLIDAFFYVHVTVHLNNFVFNRTNRRINFPNLFLTRNSKCFGQFLSPSSGVFHCTFGTGVCYAGLMTYTSVECRMENSWWWAEELLETCRVSWQK